MGAAVQADTGSRRVRLTVPGDQLAELLVCLGRELGATDGTAVGVALDDLVCTQRAVDSEPCELDMSYDAACNRRDAALQTLLGLLPEVTWEMDDNAAGALGIRLEDAGREARGFVVCEWCDRWVHRNVTVDNNGHLLCSADCDAEAQEHAGAR